MILPTDNNFEEWAASLIIDFPENNVPIFKSGYSWKIFGDAVAALDVFTQNNCPGTAGFKTAPEWAKVVYGQMINTGG